MVNKDVYVMHAENYQNRPMFHGIITSAKEVCFCRFLFVCLSVCVYKITQKVMDESFWNFEDMSGMA